DVTSHHQAKAPPVEPLPEKLVQRATDKESQGYTAVFAGWGGQARVGSCGVVGDCVELAAHFLSCVGEFGVDRGEQRARVEVADLGCAVCVAPDVHPQWHGGADGPID